MAPGPRRAAALVVALALSIGGCGDDDDSSRRSTAGEEPTATQAAPEPTAREAPTPAASTVEERQYAEGVKEALAPLTKAQDLTRSLNAGSTPGQVADALGGLEKRATAAANELEALDPPNQIAHLHERLVREHRVLAEATTSARTAAQAGDTEGVRAYRDAGGRYQQRVSRLGNEIGQKLDGP